MRKSAILAAGIAGFMTCSAFGDAFLVRDGQPLADIVMAGQPARMARLAAAELQEGIFKLTGVRLAVTNEPGPGPAVHVYVGKSAHTERLGITDAGLGDGAFRIVPGDGWLVLLGRDDDFTPPEPFMKSRDDLARATAAWDRKTGATWAFPLPELWRQHNRELGIWEQDGRGSMNAVCRFLYDEGMRWYMPGALGEIVPKKETIAVPPEEAAVRPDFAVRFPYQYFKRFEAASRDELLWQLRLGLNPAPDRIGLAYIGHGTGQVIQREEVKKAHPDYYALFNGARANGEKPVPCLSSPELVLENARYVRAVFDVYGAPMVSVMPTDGYVAMCQCERCKGKNTPERGYAGQFSDYVWDYVDRVAREVYKTHPDRKIVAMAYSTYMLPPLKIDRLSSNIVVCMAQNRADFQRDPDLRRQYAEARLEYLKKTQGGGGQLLIYEYYLHARPKSPYAFTPVFFPHAVAADLQTLKGVSMGEYVEVYREKEPAAFEANYLNLYMTARLWWDCGQDVDVLLDEYCDAFYGPAALAMRELIAYCEAQWADLHRDAARIDRVFVLLAEARKKAPPDSVYGRRVDLLAAAIAPLKELRAQLAKGRGVVPKIRIPTLDAKTITLDGKLDDPFWQAIPGEGSALKELATGAPPLNPASFKAAWAAGSLYLGITCADADMEHVAIGSTKDEDTGLWSGDCVEILLETQSHSYYQLAIGPGGALVDLDRKDGQDSRWASGAQVAAFRGPDAWSLEVRIPLAGELQGQVDPLNGVTGRLPASAYPWYFNVCRQRVRGKEAEYSAFSPTGEKGFHHPLKFAELSVR